MKPHRIRQICRSHDRFTPSIALWQHFILPCHPLHQQRLLSTVTGAAPAPVVAESPPNGDAALPPPPTTPTIAQLEERRAARGPNQRAFNLQKPRDQQNSNDYPSLRHVGIRKQVFAKVKKTGFVIGQEMRKARMAVDDHADYEGVLVNPMASSYPALEATLPWVVHQSTELRKDPMGRLALEIKKFHEYAKPSRTEALARRNVIEQVRTHARETLPEYVLEVFGSERTGLSLATSDIDFRLRKIGDETDTSINSPPLLNAPPVLHMRSTFLADLYKLQMQQFSKNPAYILPLIRNARYPLISMQDRNSGLDIQVVLSNDTALSRDTMHRYLQEYPYLRETYTLVKTIFDCRGLADVFRGGFGSYSIFMMLVAALRHEPNRRNDAAGALRNFLKFWSQFDTTKHGVSIEPVELFDKVANPVLTEKTRQQLIKGLLQPLPSYMLCLRDPADETNDLGRKGMCIKHVLTTFRHLYLKLRSDLKKNNRHSLLLPMVGDIYSLDRERRRKLDAEGRRVLTDMQASFADTAQRIREEEGEDERLPAEASLS